MKFYIFFLIAHRAFFLAVYLSDFFFPCLFLSPSLGFQCSLLGWQCALPVQALVSVIRLVQLLTCLIRLCKFDVCASSPRHLGMLQLHGNKGEVKKFLYFPSFLLWNSHIQPLFPGTPAWPLAAMAWAAVPALLGWAWDWKPHKELPRSSPGTSWLLLRVCSTQPWGSPLFFHAQAEVFPQAAVRMGQEGVSLCCSVLSHCDSVCFPWAKPNDKYLSDCKKSSNYLHTFFSLTGLCFKSPSLVFSIAYICLWMRSELYNENKRVFQQNAFP